MYWQPPRQSLDGYKHVVDVEYCSPVPSDGPKFSSKAVQAKEAAQNSPNTQSTVEYHEIVEGDHFFPKLLKMYQLSSAIDIPLKPLIFLTEEMIRGLQLLGWKKVDVSFHSAFWPFFAHNNIHVLHPFNTSNMADDDGIIDTKFVTREIVWFQVKNEWFHNAGVGVIAHVADSLKQQEASLLSASLWLLYVISVFLGHV